MKIPDEIWAQLPGLNAGNLQQPRMFMKSVSFPIASVAANASLSFNQPTYDDNRIRVVVGTWASVSTAGNYFQLITSGRTMASTDYSMFSATYGAVDCFVPFQVNTPVQVNIQCVAGVAAHYGTLLYAVFDPTFVL
jgi:hypothetical protein